MNTLCRIYFSIMQNNPLSTAIRLVQGNSQHVLGNPCHRTHHWQFIAPFKSLLIEEENLSMKINKTTLPLSLALVGVRRRGQQYVYIDYFCPDDSAASYLITRPQSY